MTGLLN